MHPSEAGAREALTARQRTVLAAIRQRLRASGAPPTVRELRDHLGLRSIGAVQDHLAALRRKGYLRWRPGVSRGLAPIDEPLGSRLVPILGRVPAGTPVPAEQDIEGWLPVGESLSADAFIFSLRVKGDSMIEAGILDGDLVIVRPQPEAEPGEIVVAVIDGEGTVKRLARRAGRLFLDAANPAYAPIPFDEEPGGVSGKVIGVWRRLP